MSKFLLLFFCLGLSGCATLTLSQVASKNKDNLKRLSLGMSEEEVSKVMGTRTITSSLWDFYTRVKNPYRSEVIQTKTDKPLRVFYYFTELQRDQVVWEKYTIQDNDLTPLVFEEGRLVGIGAASLPKLILEEKDKEEEQDRK